MLLSAVVYPAIVCETSPDELLVSRDVIQLPEMVTSNINLNGGAMFSACVAPSAG